MLSAKNEEAMPKNDKGQVRHADVIKNAVHVMRIATGEIDDMPPETGKNKVAQELGKLGGQKRAQNMSAEKRSEIAKKAAEKRWG
jgi:hypothetical protein